jgi:4-hydroxythreonine-4-phosphate dehydrogenase
MSKIKVGISIGDLNGIGMEVILKTFKDNRMMDFCTPIIFGSSKVASIHRKALDFQDFSFNVINSIKDAHPKKANLLNIWKEDIELSLGKSSVISGKYAFDSIKSACKALTDGEIDEVIVWITSIWPAEVYGIWYKEIERKYQEKKEHKLD